MIAASWTPTGADGVFRLSSLGLGLMLFAIVLGWTALGIFAGRRLRAHSETLREPFCVLQAALLGLVALILAFGLSMAVGRYDQRELARPAHPLYRREHRALPSRTGQHSLGVGDTRR